MHEISSRIIPFVTQFGPRWVKIWLSPVFIAGLLVIIGRLMPWESVYLYPVQALLLTVPMWIMMGWFIWTLLCCLWWRKRWWLILIALPGLGWPWAAVDREAKGTKVLVANVNAFTGRAQFLQSYIELLHVDVAVLIEKRAEEIRGMTRAADDFSTPVKRPSHHIAVFCRQDCEAWVSPQIGSQEMSMSLALVRLPSEKCLIAIHAPPPVPVVSTGMRPYIEHVAKYISNGRLKADWEVCRKSDRVIVMGDMNAVAGSWPYRTLMDTGLQDHRLFSGVWGVTWPTGAEAFVDFPFFRIDHILSGGVEIKNIQLIDIPDSDHKGFTALFPFD